MANTVYRLDTARLQNYRCYGEDFKTVHFGTECTVIIGYNGAGKTAFLSGIKKAASFILSKDKRRTVSFIGDGKDIRETPLRVDDVRYQYDTGLFETDYHYPCCVSLSGSVMGLNLSWDYLKIDKRTPLDKMAFRTQLDAVLKRYAERNRESVLPLLAFFSDCYPHVRADLSKYEKDVIVNKSNQIERRAGYYRWDATSTDFFFWRDLFCKALQRLNHPTTGLLAVRNRLVHEGESSLHHQTLMQHVQELQSVECQINYVTRIIKQFTRIYPTQDNHDFAVEDITVGSYLENSKEVFTLMFHFSNGKHILFEMLPEGHKRLLAIAFEIAYRFFILNQSLIQVCPDFSPQGIALIDELELHLHPTLAQEALIRLRDTFPEVQFIVSTHSPAVISNIKNDGTRCKVLQLDSNHQFTDVEDCFGLDYSDTLLLHMGSYGRMHFLALQEELYREYKEDQDLDGQESVKQALQRFFGQDPQAEEWTRDILSQWNRQMEE